MLASEKKNCAKMTEMAAMALATLPEFSISLNILNFHPHENILYPISLFFTILKQVFTNEKVEYESDNEEQAYAPLNNN
jgi:hypothetical protein